MGVEVAEGETPSLTGEFVGETHRVLGCTQTHPPRNQHQKGRPNVLVGSGGSDWKPTESTAIGIVPSRTLLHIQPCGLPHPGEHLSLPPLLPNRQTETKKKKKTQKKAQIKAPEEIQRRRESQPIRCTVQNTGNQDAHRIGWIWSQIRGKKEGYKKWNKGKYTGNQQSREGNQDSSQWFVPEGINKHSTRTEWRNTDSKIWGEALEPPEQL